jgi:hypothetical protein
MHIARNIAKCLLELWMRPTMLVANMHGLHLRVELGGIHQH